MASNAALIAMVTASTAHDEGIHISGDAREAHHTVLTLLLQPKAFAAIVQQQFLLRLKRNTLQRPHTRHVRRYTELFLIPASSFRHHDV